MTEKKGNITPKVQKAPQKPRAKDMTLGKLNKNYKKLAKWSTYVLDEETNLVLKYKEKFDKMEINQILTDMYNQLEYVEKKEYNFLKDETELVQYMHFLMIKQFTHLGKDIGEDIESQIPVMTELIATGLFEFIFEHVFEQDEVLAVIAKFQERVDIIKRIGDYSAEMQEEYAEKLINKDLLSQVFTHDIQKP